MKGISCVLLMLLTGMSTGAVLAAKSWGITGEEKARFTATVVDVLCELADDCPDQCGGGSRQLGLMTDEEVLVLVTKSQVHFAGAVVDLLPYCGKSVQVDGLYTENHGVRVFAIQFLRPVDGQWGRADEFLESWAKEHNTDSDSDMARQWFRHDERIKSRIQRKGILGLGADSDPPSTDSAE